MSKTGGEWTARAFPAWMTLPTEQNLAAARRWHFFFAWLFVFNGLIYLATGVLLGRFRRDLLLRPAELAPRQLWQDILDHMRLRFPKGEAARRYNSVQKLAYLTVIVSLLPLMVLTGLTMSPAIDAAAPFLPELFGGRPSARTLHFATASLIVAFVIVHLVMVLLSGVWNNLRSMTTGRYEITLEGAE